MNLAIVYRLLALILGVLTLAMLLCLGVAWFLEGGWGGSPDQGGFLAAAVLSGSLAAFLGWRGRQGDWTFQAKEALAVIGLGWIMASLIGAIPIYLGVEGATVPNAIFESASGLTTTGASAFSDIEALPPGVLFWRSLSQWIGGLGVVVFFVAVLSALGTGAKILFSRESSSHSSDAFDGKMRTAALRIMGLYLLLSVLCGLAYVLAGLSVFDAICHAFTTIATGGFSTRSASLAAFDSAAVEWVAIVFMTLGGTSFFLLLRLARGEWGAARQNAELHTYLLLLLLASLVMCVFLVVQGTESSFHDALRSGAFQVVSLGTTTGYTTRDYNEWIPSTGVILLLLMLIGGSSGSTSGGLKVIRVVVCFRVILHEIERSFRFRVVRPLRINGRNLSLEARDEILLYTLLVVVAAALSILVVSVLEPGEDLVSVFSAVPACLFNIGPGLGHVGPTGNFGVLSGPTQLYLAFLMILGRLEFFAVLALFSPALWKKFS